MEDLFNDYSEEYPREEFYHGDVITNNKKFEFKLKINPTGKIILSVAMNSYTSEYTKRIKIFNTFEEFKDSKIGIEILNSLECYVPGYIISELEGNKIDVNAENAYYYLNTQRLNSSAKSAHVKK
jgi:hypothetical protein